jgi:hypothetical protein
MPSSVNAESLSSWHPSAPPNTQPNLKSKICNLKSRVPAHVSLTVFTFLPTLTVSAFLTETTIARLSTTLPSM